jgi:hypothetical protein
MTVPGIVQSVLGGEDILDRIQLGGGDELFVTDAASVLYRSEGLLSDESISRCPHGADRVSVSSGRRKPSIAFEYTLEDDAEITVPEDAIDDVLPPVLAGVLRANDVIDADESVIELYRFSELALVLTDRRLIKCVDEAVWDDECEVYSFADVTNLTFETGSVATQLVLTVNGRKRRIKTPNKAADDIRERLQQALFAFHDVDSLDEFNATFGPDDPSTPSGEAEPDGFAFGDADSLETTGGDDHNELGALERALEGGGEGDTQTEPAGDAATLLGSGTTSPEPADETTAEAGAESPSDDKLFERLDALEQAVEEQGQRLEEQQRTIEQLIEELRNVR